MTIFSLCNNSDCTAYFSFNVESEVSKQYILDKAYDNNFKVCDDQFYCERCIPPNEEIILLKKEVDRLEQEKKELERQVGRAHFEVGVYQQMYNEQVGIVKRLMTQSQKRTWKFWRKAK